LKNDLNNANSKNFNITKYGEIGYYMLPKSFKNTIQAYDLLLSLNPYSENDLLKAHKLMLQGLVNESGKNRTDGVGIFDGNKVVHLAPPAKRVSELVNLQIFYMLVNSLKHLNNEQNKTMMVHYVKVEFYVSLVKLHYCEK